MDVEPTRVRPNEATSRRYATLKRSSTRPEVALRSSLHALGKRFRIQFRVDGLPRRRIDIAFPRQQLAVFVDGCFCHGCPEHGTRPETNREWWDWKIARNRARDVDTDQRLKELGWRVIRVWEHAAAETAAEVIVQELSRPSPRGDVADDPPSSTPLLDG